jgi:DNA-binding transcriptional LysR family regulator
MNLWAFTPAILPVLEGAFRRFLERHPGNEAELRLADGVQEGIVRREATVRVLPTMSRWCGVTHPSDRDWVQARLAELVRDGVYPERLV